VDRGSYLSEDLDEAYVTNGDARAALVARQVRKIVTDVDRMRALGFCASVKHARFMTRKFNAMGIASACLVGDTPSEERRQIRHQLRAAELRWRLYGGHLQTKVSTFPNSTRSYS